MLIKDFNNDKNQIIFLMIGYQQFVLEKYFHLAFFKNFNWYIKKNSTVWQR